MRSTSELCEEYVRHSGSRLCRRHFDHRWWFRWVCGGIFVPVLPFVWGTWPRTSLFDGPVEHYREFSSPRATIGQSLFSSAIEDYLPGVQSPCQTYDQLRRSPHRSLDAHWSLYLQEQQRIQCSVSNFCTCLHSPLTCQSCDPGYRQWSPRHVSTPPRTTDRSVQCPARETSKSLRSARRSPCHHRLPHNGYWTSWRTFYILSLSAKLIHALESSPQLKEEESRGGIARSMAYRSVHHPLPMEVDLWCDETSVRRKPRSCHCLS